MLASQAQAPQVMDADHDLLASAETVISSEFKAIESLVRRSLSILSYIEHFDVASTKLLQQLVEEVGQMLLDLKLSWSRAISHLANIEAKLLDNMILARRVSFLDRRGPETQELPACHLCDPQRVVSRSAYISGLGTGRAQA